MEKNPFGGLNPWFLPRVLVVWLLTAFILLIVSAGIITLADMKASSFSAFAAAVGFISSAVAGYCAKKRSVAPTWQIAGISALTLTILLLTVGFLVSGKGMTSEGVLSVAAGTVLGCLVGAVLASKAKKLQKNIRTAVLKKRR